MNITIMAEAADVRESIRSWAVQYAAKAEEAARAVTGDPDFQGWAAEQIRNRPRLTIEECARHWINENGAVEVPWPSSVAPEGALVEVTSQVGREVNVSFEYEIEDPCVPNVGASVGLMISVVVDDRNHPDPEITIGHYYVSRPTISHWGVEDASESDPTQIRALAGVLLRAAELLPAVAHLARRFGGSEDSLETESDAPPIGCPEHPHGRFSDCAPCGTARRRHDRWVVEHADSRAAS